MFGAVKAKEDPSPPGEKKASSPYWKHCLLDFCRGKTDYNSGIAMIINYMAYLFFIGIAVLHWHSPLHSTRRSRLGLDTFVPFATVLLSCLSSTKSPSNDEPAGSITSSTLPHPEQAILSWDLCLFYVFLS